MKIAKLTKGAFLESINIDNIHTPLDPGEGAPTLQRMGFRRVTSGQNVNGLQVDVWVRGGMGVKK